METAVISNPNRAPVALTAGNDHPVVDLPFSATIDGRQFRGRGLSLVAAYVSGLVDPAMLNAARLVRLMFQFDGFSVSLVVDALVRQAANGSGEVELVFTQPTGPHLPQLRHILNAFIAGDLVGLGQTIGVAGTAAPKRPRSVPLPARRMTLRQLIGGAAIGLLSIVLVAIAATLAHQKMFVTFVPTPGTVVSTGEVLRATTTGQIVFLDPEAAEGEVAVAIQSASGEVQSLVMPCDCEVAPNRLREGSTVLIGEPVLHLASANDERLVSAAIPDDLMFDLAAADRVELTFPDGSRALAVQDRSGSVGTGSEGEGTTVLLRPEQPVSADRLGDPVRIRILRDTSALGDWIGAARDRVTALFERN